MAQAVLSRTREYAGTADHAGPALLTPFTENGTVDISDIADLAPDELRRALVERANALRPLLESNAVGTEKNRRVVEENISAIQQAGLYRIMVRDASGDCKQTSVRSSNFRRLWLKVAVPPAGQAP